MYNCRKCPGFCCSYPLIALDKRDVERLASHHGLSFDTARRKFTKAVWGRKYVMRQKADTHFGKICRFFDIKKRCCTIYKARPASAAAIPARPLRLLRFPDIRAACPGRPQVGGDDRPHVMGRCRQCPRRAASAPRTTANVNVARAAKFSTAEAACEYSHCRRASLEILGHHGPIAARGVHWIGEGPEDHLAWRRGTGRRRATAARPSDHCARGRSAKACSSRAARIGSANKAHPS